MADLSDEQKASKLDPTLYDPSNIHSAETATRRGGPRPTAASGTQQPIQKPSGRLAPPEPCL